MLNHADQQKLAQRYKVWWLRAQKESARETKDARETEVELWSAVSILKRRLAEHRADIDALYEQSEESDHIITELIDSSTAVGMPIHSCTWPEAARSLMHLLIVQI
eukprot:SAG31_NODE_2454_length_5664_cov_4.255885_7_plen_106_part_00